MLLLAPSDAPAFEADPYVHPKGYVARHTTQPIHCDGVLDEAAWQAAPWTDDFVDIEGDIRPKPRHRTRVKMLWDDKNFYIAAELEEPHVQGSFTKHDSYIFHEDNDFEVFIDPDGDNHLYAELEMNALNTTWDLRLTKPYRDGGRAEDAWEIPGLQTAVHVHGTVNNPGDMDGGWSIEIAIPWDIARALDGAPAIPPRDGGQWRVNFSRVQWRYDDKDGKYVRRKGQREDNWVWSPQGTINMHRPERWGYVQFSRSDTTTMFRPDPAGPAKHFLHRIHEAQTRYATKNKRFASSLAELEMQNTSLDELVAEPIVHGTADQFHASADVRLPDGTVQRWTIRHDSRIRADSPPRETEIPIRQAVVIPPVGRYGRTAVIPDAIVAKIAAGTWQAPRAGDELPLPDGQVRRWEPLDAAQDGTFSHNALVGGYAHCTVSADSDRVMILEASGHSMVYINGEPRAGDPYGTGYVHLPVALKNGRNELLFHVGRGRLKARLVAARPTAQFHLGDTTAPDLLVGSNVDTQAAVLVLNNTATTLDGLSIVSNLVGAAGSVPSVSPVPAIPPLSLRKVAIRMAARAPTAPGKCELELRLTSAAAAAESPAVETLDTATVPLRVLAATDTHKRTFLSDIDGSVQYYAVVPAIVEEAKSEESTESRTRPGLVLTLHGAGVEAIGQAACYARKPNLHVVAPTNRRPFGFDWEDWGRLDAIEVLDLVQMQLDTDPRHTYLTGHSMGGHGTWQIGATHPDRFAAIGPSAGWISMWSYAGARQPEGANTTDQVLRRATSPSDTLALSSNYAPYGVYVLHGENDDNVPVGQARTMRSRLAEFHGDFVYYERPGAGHWWGNACVDWPPMFEFFARHAIPERKDIHRVDFVTANPAVAAWSHWAGIEAQVNALQPSSVNLRLDPAKRLLSGSTSNVARLAIDLRHLAPGEPLQAELDGTKLPNIPWPGGDSAPTASTPREPEPRIWFHRTGSSWTTGPAARASLKGPQRSGPFKEAFRNRVLFVYATQGTDDENAWALAKARYDAETFWYRGNASVDVLSDTTFLARRTTAEAQDRDRNVILYGNADAHAAWPMLLGDSPVQVRRDEIRIGERSVAGSDLACLFVRPRPDSDRASVGVVSGSGPAGMRLTDRLPYFVSGVAYPDCVVLGPESLIRGTAGIRAAGFFGLDWSVATGEFVWLQ